MRTYLNAGATTKSLLELAGCELAFVGITLLTLPEAEPAIALAEAAGLTAVAFWWGFQIGASSSRKGVPQSLMVAMGMALLFQALLAYSGIGEPMPRESIVGGFAGAALLTLLLERWFLPKQEKILLLGCGTEAAVMASALGPALLGVLEDSPSRVPQGVKYLGNHSSCRDVFQTLQPTTLILDSTAEEQHLFSTRQLIEGKWQGRQISTVAEAYEGLFERISLDSLHSPLFPWPETLRVNRRVMALQAIYSNLIGLVFLVGLAPLLVLLAVLSRLAAGRGPTFENTLCCGFQRVPFVRRRFRTHHAVTGKQTSVGKIISRLGLTNLPELINVVRGEMALSGPEPVLLELAIRLESYSPIYSYRFSMKPGVFGWAQMSTHGTRKATGKIVEETLRLSYDLYYLENGSPILDLEILLRTILAAWKR